MLREFVAVAGGVYLALLISGAALGADRYVPDQYATIQSAIDASVNGDTVIVRAGTYSENIDFAGRAVTVKSEAGPEATIIDGGGKGSVVVFDKGEGPDSVLCGFTITNGTGTVLPAPVNGAYYGGGILCGAGTSPVIEDNHIVRNTARPGMGGGLWCVGDALITVNLIMDNEAQHGGGIGLDESSGAVIEGNRITGNRGLRSGGGLHVKGSQNVLIRDNLFLDNNAESGGGLMIEDASPEIAANSIKENAAKAEGGGIWFGRTGQAAVCDPLIVNNIIAVNSAGIDSGRGGGIYCDHAAATVTNNTIAGNSAGKKGGGLFVASSQAMPAAVHVYNTIVWKNEAPIGPEYQFEGQANFSFAEYCDVRGGCPGTGNIDAVPRFVDAANGDFHLKVDSPCLTAGDETAPGFPEEDFEGDRRVAGNGTDIGADEFYFHLYCKGKVEPGETIMIKVVGWPGMPVHIGLGPSSAVAPIPTYYGDLGMAMPFTWVWSLPPITSDGVTYLPAMIPSFWVPGNEYPIQALVGMRGGIHARLTNVMKLKVK